MADARPSSPAATRPRASERGFTLIELIVVIALLGLILAVSAPRMRTALLHDPQRTATNWIVGNVRALKVKAVREKRDFALHLSPATNRAWITWEGMDEAEMLEAEQNSYAFPESVRITGVTFRRPPGTADAEGSPAIRFFKAGYSDHALIHTQDDWGNERSYRIEPFLSRVTPYDRRVDFEP